MSSNDNVAIRVSNLSKCYQIYSQPQDRLKQSIYPRIQRLAGKVPKQYFREFWALKEVSFEIKKGETVGIIGRNGSGKSTLLQMICGTLNPTSGSIQTNGRIAALLELGSGFNPEFTGRENVYLNAAVLGLSREEIDERFDEIVAFADIGDFIEQAVKTYSSGMMVRLAFAVAINVKPDILVIDEALAVGDELFQRKCFSRIETIKADGATVLFVSHSGSQIVELCNRAILIDGGEKLIAGLPKNIVGNYQRLLYAPHEMRNQVRDEIVGSNNSQQGSLKSAQNEIGPAMLEPTDYFDVHLIPQSTIVYETKGAIIRDPKIFNQAGRQVNCLQSRERYRYEYEVTFTEEAHSVLFGMLIKTASGVELGGGASAPSLTKALAHVSPKDKVKASFYFKCNLNPGLYFLNAGIYAIRKGEEMYLHRLLDASLFRVQPREDNLISGVVDFECEPNLKIDIANS